MSYDLPANVSSDVQSFAERHRLSIDEALLKLIVDGLHANGGGELSSQDYRQFWGAGKGQKGAFGSVEAVDQYIRELRDEW